MNGLRYNCAGMGRRYFLQLGLGAVMGLGFTDLLRYRASAAQAAGKASPKIKENLDSDELGRLRYKKNVIRLYSQERLQLMFKQRDQLEIRSESVD